MAEDRVKWPVLVNKTINTGDFFFYCCIVHFDICRVHLPTNTLFILKNTLKFTLKYT